jgi:hypothetical protein
MQTLLFTTLLVALKKTHVSSPQVEHFKALTLIIITMLSSGLSKTREYINRKQGIASGLPRRKA